MRITLFAVLVLAMPLAGCHFFSSRSSSDEIPVSKSAPGIDYGVFPQDYQLRVVEAFQAKWPADVIYKYRFELPRRVQNTNSGRYGYAVRFAAQKVSVSTPFSADLPWIAYFEYGRVVWVQRNTEVGNTLKWFDPMRETVDWPPAAAAK